MPKDDEHFALYKLEELKNEFPLRNLNIVGIKDLNEILLRRDLVEIKKQKFVVRTGKFVVKNWAGVVFAVLLTVILTSFFALDLDDNPASLTTDGITLFVKNKNGKILWTKKVELPTVAIHNHYVLEHHCRIFDINEDGKKEVIITGPTLLNDQNNRDSTGLICFTKEGNVIWTYSFTDVVVSEREIMNPYYDLNIIDTLTFGDK